MAAGQTGANLLSARQSGQWHRHQLRRWGWGWKCWETDPVDGFNCKIGNWPSIGWESIPPWWRTGRRWAWRGRCCRSWWSPGWDPPSSQGTLTRWPWQEERLSRKYKKNQENVSTPASAILLCGCLLSLRIHDNNYMIRDLDFTKRSFTMLWFSKLYWLNSSTVTVFATSQ